ncbi:Origin recognition complex subunit 4 [Schistosoma japonicum]|nr:Origin recognition complex subunit 4 [Schistosoma japonicum]
MDLISDVLRRKLRGNEHHLLYFNEELNYLQNIITSSVLKGESSSILVIGRRGVGKHHLLREAIKKAKENSDVNSGLSEVYLNGLVHTDDRSAMKSLAKQLHNETLLNSIVSQSDHGCDPDDNSHCIMKSLPFSQQLSLFLNEVHRNQRDRKTVLVVLSEFDLFALHHNQLLLYNLFDSCQSPESRICVIGLTCRLDIMELLEKRVKSRFSHRQIYLKSPAAPIENTDSYASDDLNSDTRSKPFKQFCEICKHLLSVDIGDLPDMPLRTLEDCRRCERLVKSWNNHIEKLMNDEIVIDSLRQAWSISVSIRRLMNLLIPIVASLGPEHDRIKPVQFIESLCTLQQDSKLTALKGCSVLELFLITAMVKLQDINGGKPVNFECLYYEYLKYCRSNCPGHLYEKPVVMKALDNLVDSELIVSGKAAITAFNGLSTVNSKISWNSSSVLPNYRPLFCYVDSDMLTACLDTYPSCPVELKHWIHSRTF